MLNVSVAARDTRGDAGDARAVMVSFTDSSGRGDNHTDGEMETEPEIASETDGVVECML
jgi:hypothetical protein